MGYTAQRTGKFTQHIVFCSFNSFNNLKNTQWGMGHGNGLTDLGMCLWKGEFNVHAQQSL